MTTIKTLTPNPISILDRLLGGSASTDNKQLVRLDGRDLTETPNTTQALALRPAGDVQQANKADVLVPSGYEELAKDLNLPRQVSGNSLLPEMFGTDKPLAPVFWALLSNAFTGGRGNYIDHTKALQQRDFDSLNPRRRFLKALLTPATQYNRAALMGILTGMMELGSNRLKTRVETQPTDFVVIGAGPHGAATLSKVAEMNAQYGRANQPSGLLVDAASAAVASANFGQIGTHFYINSRIRMGTEGESSLASLGTGRGDINNSGGPITVTTMTGLSYDEGKTLANAATINQFVAALTSPSLRFLYGHQVLKIDERPAGEGPRYALAMADSETGAVRTALTNKVVLSTGLGEPNIPFPEESPTFAFCDREFAAVTQVLQGLPPEEAAEALAEMKPRLLTPEQYFTMVDLLKDGRAQFRAGNSPPAVLDSDEGRAFLKNAQVNIFDVDEIVAVDNLLIASGDGSKIVAEHWAGEAPAASYNHVNSTDVAQQGIFGSTFWLTGQNGPNSCQSIKENGFRARYLKLANYVQREPKDPNRSRWRLENRNARFIGAFGDRVGVVYMNRFAEPCIVVARNVVAGFGYKTNMAPLVSDLIGIDPKARLETSAFVEDVTGLVDSDERVVGLKVKDHDIYIVGPAAGPKKLAPGNPAGVGENSAGVAGLVPCTQELVRQIVEPSKSRFPMPANAPSPLQLETDGAKATTYELGGTINKRNAPDETPKVILGHMGHTFAGARASGSDADEVKLTLHTDGQKMLLDVRGARGSGVEEAVERLREDNALLRHAGTLLKTKADAMSITYGLREDGLVDTSNAEVSLGKVRRRNA